MTLIAIEPGVADLISDARRRSGLTLRELAVRARTSHSTLSAYETGRKEPSIRTLSRILAASGFGLDLAITPRLPGIDRVERGDELRAVLELAALFPARHAQTLEAPIFPRSAA
ncbi:MAG: helix-turn-helix transcriptional regulator [Acidimicrobiales bacterium]